MDDKLIMIFEGSDVDAALVKEVLKEADIDSSLRNKKMEAAHAGFGYSSGATCEIYVHSDNEKRAKQLVKEAMDR
ncbi:MAG: DUF2007 domain-containing protein [Bacteroidales bacterium]|jgi:hypothetical protein|nr:DUF2007 domain-containing protein [Bacteroidales bacterium]